VISEVGDEDLMIVALDILFLQKAPAADDDERAPAHSVLGSILAFLAAGSSRKARVKAKVAIIVTRPSRAFLKLRLENLSDMDTSSSVHAIGCRGLIALSGLVRVLAYELLSADW
jgi:hypothetical protein